MSDICSVTNIVAVACPHCLTRERDYARAEAEMHRERVNVTRENYSADIDRLRALLRECQSWIHSDGSLPSAEAALRARIAAALEGRDDG